MRPKRWITASAGTAMLAVAVTGGFGWMRADASTGTRQAEPTPTPAPATADRAIQVSGAPAVVFNGVMGQPCIGGASFGMPVHTVHFDAAGVSSVPAIAPFSPSATFSVAPAG